MNMEPIDVELLEILRKCNCEEHEALFQGVTLAQLRKLTTRQLRLKLLALLPSVVSSDVTATAIASEIRKSDITIKQEPIDVKIKVEKLESDPPTMVSNTDDDDEVMIIDEVVGEVSVVGAWEDTGRKVTEVTIDDDDEMMTDSEKENLPEQKAISAETWSTSEVLPTAQFLPTPCTIAKIKETQKTAIIFTDSKMVKTHDKPMLKPVKGVGSKLAKGSLYLQKYTKSKWGALYEACGPGKICCLECSDWEWSALNQGSPKNLFRLVSNHCTNLVEINFTSNVTMTSKFPRKLSLPNLRVLKVSCNVDEVFNYGAILKEVILAAHGNLQRLEYICDNSLSLVPFLKALKAADGRPRCGLSGLQALSIENYTQDPFLMLTLANFKILANLSCLELRDLTLEVCVMDEVESHFNTLLKKFTKLRKMIFTGCFLTKNAIAPQIKLDFSAIKTLESLELGPNFVSNSIFDSVDIRPPKGRKGRKIYHQIRVENSQGQKNAGQQNQVPSYFPVAVRLPALPNLRKLRFGRLYELDELHLRSWPALTSFMVCSPWQLATGLQTDIDRQTTFPNVTAVQLPDELEDDGFVRSVMPVFPKVQHVYIDFPTVRVLRAFAYSMKSVKSLDYVSITTQFEFPSTMDTCFLEKPSQVEVSKEEAAQVKILKKYKYWREWAGYHGVEVPYTKADLRELENKEKYAGLCVLKDNFANKERFELQHISRQLRLPAGNLHWDHDDCKYSETLIGFKKFPTNVVLEKASEELHINFWEFKGKVYKSSFPNKKTKRREKCIFEFDSYLMANVGKIKKDETD